MKKLSTRNAKDTIFELVMIVWIVVTHKLLQFEDINLAVTLLTFLTFRNNLRRKENLEQLFQ